jgi:hypothetical protein
MDDMLFSPEKHWRTFRKKGKLICVPRNELYVLHYRLKQYFDRRTHLLSTAVAAWSRGCSIIENARRHECSRSGLRLDMQNAFESVEATHVYRYLLRACSKVGDFPPALLFSKDECWVLSRLLTYRGRLRKGSPVSQVVFNMVCTELDEELLQMVRAYRGTVYSRYGDDLCFSSPEKALSGLLVADIHHILESHHVVLNQQKTREFKNGRLHLPGVSVVDGELYPSLRYLEKMSRTPLDSLSAEQQAGHRGHLRQFHPNNVPRRLLKLRDGPSTKKEWPQHDLFELSDIPF